MIYAKTADVIGKSVYCVTVNLNIHLVNMAVACLSTNALVSINVHVVALRQARLVLGWVTVCERVNRLDWLIEQCFTSPPTQCRLYGRRFLPVRRPNQQYQSTEGEGVKPARYVASHLGQLSLPSSGVGKSRTSLLGWG